MRSTWLGNSSVNKQLAVSQNEHSRDNFVKTQESYWDV